MKFRLVNPLAPGESVEEYLKELLEKARKRRPWESKEETRQRELATIKTFLKWLRIKHVPPKD